MARKSLQEEVEAVAALRRLSDEDELRRRLRAALGDRRPLIAGRAARVAAERMLSDLVPEVVAALDRLLGPEDAGRDPYESDTDDTGCERPDDPGCLGKTELARALLDLEAEAPDVFLRGARCVQMEPVWGGQEDAAGELRGLCAMGLGAMGLAGSPDRRAGELLADLLADPEAAARAGAVRGLAASGRVGAELLLRFKARLGDEEPGVLLDAFSGLLEMEPTSGLEPVLAGLDSTDETRFEAAAIALGSSRHPEALAVLARALETQRLPGRQKFLYRAVALVRGDESAEFLARQVAEAPEATVRLLFEALGETGVDPRLRDRLGEAVDARRDRELSRAFRSFLAP